MAKPPRSLALPDWEDVRFFLAIHRAGSLSAAAGPLGVTQPTCGRRLAALEAALGLRLFERTPEGLRVTPAGSSLLEAALAMERGAEALALRAAARDGELAGVVRIATTEAFAYTFLVGALPELRRRYPGLRIELVLSNTPSDLLRREADVALRFVPEGQRPTPPLLVARKLSDEPFRLYATDDYLSRRGTPADPAVLAGHDVVVYSLPHPALAWCATAFQGANVVLSVPSMLVAISAAAAGLGLVVAPARTVRRFPALVPLSPVIARGTGYLVLHPDLQHVPRVRATVDTLAELFRGDPVV